MRHVMFDLETFGVKPGCIIPTIGLVVFDRNEILQEFQVHVDPLDAEKHGLRCEASTVLWWLDQSKEAQAALTKEKGMSLDAALDSLYRAIDWSTIDRVWCNGASFDFPILKAAHEAVGRKLPWPYYAEMDFRTFKNLFAKIDFTYCKVTPTTAHDSLADARAQAQTIMNLLDQVDKGLMQWAA